MPCASPRTNPGGIMIMNQFTSFRIRPAPGMLPGRTSKSVLRAGVVIAIVLMIGPSLASGAEDAPPVSVAITHVTVIDGAGIDTKEAAARTDRTVLIRGDRIVSVVPAGEAVIPAGAVVVDGRGKFLIPGLWDMHVHLAKAGANTLPLFVANGVTSVRDMGGDFAEVLKWRTEIAAGQKLGPRIKTAGPILESARHVEGMLKDRTIEPVERTRIGVANAEAAGPAVDFVAGLGADFVKIRTVQSLESYRAIAAAAKRAGLPLVGHAVASPEEMLHAGQRSIEHILLPPLDKMTEPQRSELFKRFVESGMAVVPTLVNGEKSLFVPYADAAAVVDDSDGKIDPRRKYLSGYLIEDWREQLAERKSSPPIDWAKMAPRLRRDLKEMHRAGVRIMPGTDVAVLLIAPGFSLHDELHLLVQELGMTNGEALMSATRHPAEFFGMEDSLGTVEAGKLADLVLLDADPLKDIRNTQRISGVVLNGKYLDRATLDAALVEVEAAARKERGDDAGEQ
jgi:imidazolonepropionase-like amidohydrolase